MPTSCPLGSMAPIKSRNFRAHAATFLRCPSLSISHFLRYTTFGGSSTTASCLLEPCCPSLPASSPGLEEATSSEFPLPSLASLRPLLLRLLLRLRLRLLLETLLELELRRRLLRLLPRLLLRRRTGSRAPRRLLLLRLRLRLRFWSFRPKILPASWKISLSISWLFFRIASSFLNSFSRSKVCWKDQLLSRFNFETASPVA
mmetsp:Transcript_6906/g.15085  ORF Transcript_6906/g.15085 Transcript_6906/m.15085 type:complete len:202 (-) Transcript_6906:610-1215(-)